jgi:protein disulfide-isomerase
MTTMSGLTTALGLMIAALLLCGATTAPWPYDETADAAADITAALSRATGEQKEVLLIFGANWCEDCRVLNAAMNNAPLAERIAERYVVVKVDVGNWDKNLDVVKAWGDPITNGIPSIVVVAADGSIAYTTKAGELANARRMGSTSLTQFFATLPERSP